MVTHMTSPEELLERHPLLRFSLYTEVQCQFLVRFGKETSELLDQMLAKDGVVDGDFNLAYGRIWLWILGAYEVVRTMCQAKLCFSDEYLAKLTNFKNDIAEIRIPFAKQERRGLKQPIHSELSVSDFDFDRKDFAFDLSGHKVHFRDLYDAFAQLVQNVSGSDIKQRLESSYHSRPTI